MTKINATQLKKTKGLETWIGYDNDYTLYFIKSRRGNSTISMYKCDKEKLEEKRIDVDNSNEPLPGFLNLAKDIQLGGNLDGKMPDVKETLKKYSFYINEQENTDETIEMINNNLLAEDGYYNHEDEK